MFHGVRTMLRAGLLALPWPAPPPPRAVRRRGST